MNKSVYTKNMEALEKKYPVWAKILRTRRRKKTNFDVIVEQSYTGETIFKINDHGKKLYLNGKYAPSATVDEWFMQQGAIDKFATIIIIGISNGVHIKKIMEQVPKTVNILIYEPSYEIFRRAMEEVDLSFIFELNIPVGIVVEEINEDEIQRYFQYLITYDNLVSLKIFMSGNYKELFNENVEKFIKSLKRYINQIEVSWNTVVRYTDVNARNIFHNLRYLYEGYSISELQGILPPDVPVIVVSAGPSLGKNIMDLKEAQGKACIIATDTAMKPLLNAGIIPDLFVIVDGLKPAELFEHKDISKCGMVTMTAVSREPMDLHKGKKYFYYSGSVFETNLLRHISAMEKREVYLPDLPSGGSVATSAYSLGVYMGARTIILIGQDLALTGNKVHVDGAFANEKCDIDMESGEFVEVDAVGGGKVITRLDFKNYLDWFEKTIETWSHILTIDATEGGALIHGAKNMTLKKAIKKYCTKEYNAKWHIARAKRLFRTDDTQQVVLRFFEDTPKELQNVKEKAKDGINYYEKLQKMIASGLVNSKKFHTTYKKIKKINSFMENDSIAETVMDSLKGVEFSLRPLIYQVKDNEVDEMNEIAEQGKVLLSAASIAAAEIEDIVKEELIPFAEKQKNLRMKKE